LNLRKGSLNTPGQPWAYRPSWPFAFQTRNYGQVQVRRCVVGQRRSWPGWRASHQPAGKV